MLRTHCDQRGLRRDPQLHPESAGESQHGGEARVAIWTKGLVQTFASHADFLRQLGHISGAGDVIEGGADQASVTGILVQARFKIEPYVLGGVEVISGVPAGESLGHCLSPFAGQLPGAFDVSALTVLVTATQEDDDDGTLTDEVKPVARPGVDSHLLNAVPDGSGIADVTLGSPTQTCVDAGDGTAVQQAPQPSLECGALEYLYHEPIVNHSSHHAQQREVVPGQSRLNNPPIIYISACDERAVSRCSVARSYSLRVTMSLTIPCDSCIGCLLRGLESCRSFGSTLILSVTN